MKNSGFKNMPKRQAKKFEKLKTPKDTPTNKDVPVPKKDEWWRRKPEGPTDSN